MNNVTSLTLTDLSPCNRDAPDLLNISRLAEPPQLVLMQAARGRKLQLHNRSEWGQKWSDLLAGNQLAEQAVSLLSSSPDIE